MISRGRRKCNKGNTGIQMLCTVLHELQFFVLLCVLRVPGIRSDDMCLIDTGAPTLCMSYCFCCCWMLRILGMRSDDVCWIVALDVKMSSWFDLLLL